MVRKKPQKQDRDDEERPDYWPLTPNQVVAFNLTAARSKRGWTQDQAAEALEPYLGVRWSKASFSAAERSITGKVVRNFTADEIVAFARAFEVPVTFFFMPPPARTADGAAVGLDVPGAQRWGRGWRCSSTWCSVTATNRPSWPCGCRPSCSISEMAR